MRVANIDAASRNAVLRVAIGMIHVESSGFTRRTAIRYAMLHNRIRFPGITYAEPLVRQEINDKSTDWRNELSDRLKSVAP